MEILILTTYAAVVIVVFKVLRLPVNGFSVTTAALGGFGLLAALMLLMNYNHPYTRVARFYYHTTPIVPEVRGKVIEVAVSDAQHVKAGDVLFRIDPTPYQAAVDKSQAQLAAAKEQAEELKVMVTAYKNTYDAAIAERDAANDTYERNKKLVSQNAASESDFVLSRQSYLESVAQVGRAEADWRRAKLEAESTINNVQTAVATAEAGLAAAQFNLDQTIVRAPTDGAVLQVLLRPGMMAVPLPLKPVMVFQHAESDFFVASFLQNNAQRIANGAEAEAILAAAPGRVFKGKVTMVGAAVAQGQLQPSGDMIDADKISLGGRINVVIEFDGNTFDGFQIPPGSSSQVAVYSDHVPQVALLRRVLLRMKSWTNFVFSDG